MSLGGKVRDVGILQQSWKACCKQGRNGFDDVAGDSGPGRRTLLSRGTWYLSVPNTGAWRDPTPRRRRPFPSRRPQRHKYLYNTLNPVLAGPIPDFRQLHPLLPHCLPQAPLVTTFTRPPHGRATNEPRQFHLQYRISAPSCSPHRPTRLTQFPWPAR